MTVHPDGRMTTRFGMPFADSVSVCIQHRGGQPVTVSGSALRADYDWDAGRSMHFHTRWRADLEMNERSSYDLPFVLADGRKALRDRAKTPRAKLGSTSCGCRQIEHTSSQNDFSSGPVLVSS